MVDCPQEAYAGPELPVDPLQVLCDKVEAILDGIVMTQTVVLEPESKELLAACIAEALDATTLTVTLSNVNGIANAIGSTLEPKLQAIIDAINSTNTSLLAALTAQTAALVASITEVCNKIEASNVLLAAIDAKLASNQVSLLDCLEEIKVLLNVPAPGIETKFCKPRDFGQNTSGSSFEDVAGSPITRVIELDIPEDGVFLGARIRLNALATFGGTQTSVSFVLTNEDSGETYTTNAVNTFGGVFPHDFLLETPLEVTRGQFFSLRAVVEEGGIADEVQFNGTSTRQIAYFAGAGNDGNPMITFLVEGQETVTKVTFTDKSEQFFDNEGVCIDELPSGFTVCPSADQEQARMIAEAAHSFTPVVKCYEVEGVPFVEVDRSLNANEAILGSETSGTDDFQFIARNTGKLTSLTARTQNTGTTDGEWTFTFTSTAGTSTAVVPVPVTAGQVIQPAVPLDLDIVAGEIVILSLREATNRADIRLTISPNGDATQAQWSQTEDGEAAWTTTNPLWVAPSLILEGNTPSAISTISTTPANNNMTGFNDQGAILTQEEIVTVLDEGQEVLCPNLRPVAAPAVGPKIVESIKYCIDDPDNEGESLRVFRYLYDDGTVGEEMSLTTIAPGAKECC